MKNYPKNRRKNGEAKGAKELKCAIVNYELMCKMAGQDSIGWFLDYLIKGEWERRTVKPEKKVA